MKRLMLLTAMAAAVGALAAAGTTALAAGAHRAREPIESGNGNCGLTTGAPKIGTVTFIRSGDTLTVKVALTRGDPNISYTVVLFDGSNCSLITTLGTVVTDSRGRGKGSFSASVTGHNEFFVDVQGGAVGSIIDNDSLIANLPAA